MEAYQNHSFEQLLQDGRISEALQLRIEGMEAIAYNTRVTMEASKAVTAGGVAIGVVFSANPLIALLAGIGGALYATALWKDFSTTNKLCPIPGMRKGLMEIIQGSGRADQGATHEEDPLMLTQGYLEPQQRDEYEILVARESALTAYLKQFVGEQRLPAYRFAMRHARLQTYLNLPSVEQGREAIVMPIAPSLPATQIQPAPGQPHDDDVLEDGAIQAAIYPPQNGDVAALPRLSDAVMSQAATAIDDDRYTWTKDLLNFPAVLIWGSMGSGKTSFASWLLRQRIKAGHKSKVFDPHVEYGQWNGLKVVGAGMNYSACDIAMQDFIARVRDEYKARSKQPNYSPTRETTLVDEFTQWAANCSHSGEFFITALSDIRKIQKAVIFISHDRSLAGLGGAKGFSQARDNGLAELHLLAIVDPATGEPRPAMKGKLKIPGKAAREVEIAPWMNGAMNFSDVVQADVTLPTITPDQQATRAKLEGLYRVSPETSSEMPETDPNRVRRVVEMKRNEMTQKQIIAIEWGAKAGDNQPYRDAVEEYKRIIDRHWQN